MNPDMSIINRPGTSDSKRIVKHTNRSSSNAHMRKKCSALTLLLAISCLTHGQTRVQENAEGLRVESLRQQAIPVRSIEPADEDFSDLLPLIEKIGEARVIVLGEATHEDGATYAAKSRMVRFLHQRMGFDVLAWEAGFIDCWMMNVELRSPDILLRHINTGGAWENSIYVRPLFEYARASVKTSRPLEMTGFDRWRPLKGKRNFDWILNGLFTHAPFLKFSAEEQSVIDSVNAKVFGYLRPDSPAITDDEYKRWQGLIAGLRMAIEKNHTRLLRTFSASRLALINRALIEAQSDGKSRYLFGKFGATKDPIFLKQQNEFRDADMADNFLWQLSAMYPNRKIIIWAATAHLIRNSSSIENRDDKNAYKNYKQMGDYLYRNIQQQLYTIAFTTYQGKSGLILPEDYKSENSLSDLDLAPAESFESLAHQTGKPYLFMDLRHLGKNHWLRQPVVSTCLGRLINRADWSSVIDAFFFIDTMTPNQWLPRNQ